MYKKQVLVVFSLALVAAMLLSSCGTPAATTAAPATAAPATAAPATAAPATAAPATAAPATAAPATAAPATAAPAGKVWKIGFLAGTVDPFYTTMQRGAAQAAADLGVDLITQVPQTWNVTAQTPMLDAMVARGDLNFLFLAPVDSQAMIAPLQKANDAGLPLLTVDTYIGDGDYANGPVKFPISFIASDNYLGGQIACRALADALNKTGKIYIQNVKPGISSTDAREKGCKDVLKAEYPNVTMVGVD
ncbi:MAG: substrate-binding domain-containing protein, partial [Anaerolineales bacterium]